MVEYQPLMLPAVAKPPAGGLGGDGVGVGPWQVRAGQLVPAAACAWVLDAAAENVVRMSKRRSRTQSVKAGLQACQRGRVSAGVPGRRDSRAASCAACMRKRRCGSGRTNHAANHGHQQAHDESCDLHHSCLMLLWGGDRQHWRRWVGGAAGWGPRRALLPAVLARGASPTGGTQRAPRRLHAIIECSSRTLRPELGCHDAPELEEALQRGAVRGGAGR